ncbi:SH3 domain-containing protein [Butyrivibrio sp. X503]|uniref:SH3 domain-containing protein n=1 Tax=Butyrivibrio sp. X503 TaxID=2364878 RepID=UPI000EA8CBCF|nr:SH3 domain-containing protein [Butyrivibrio sp. X503]RKM56513.1 SH3 domain-containing protein [Butyrivibrio sp. X503]
MKRKKNKNDLLNWRNEKKSIIAFLEDNKKLLMPIILGVAVIVTVAIALSANHRAVKEAATNDNAAQEDLYAVKDATMVEETNSEIIALIEKYYAAAAEGDKEVIKEIYKGLDETEVLKAVAASGYIESFGNIKVYTKPGPVEGSYIAYVYNEAKLIDYDKPVPGLDTMYICTAEDGSFYINGDITDEAEIQYIKQVNVQADVIDLNNKVASQYNEMVNADEQLAELIDKMRSELPISVGEALASAQASNEAEESAAEASSEEVEEAPETITQYTIKATSVINIRSSDSETAEVIGKTETNQEFKQLEARANGWSKIEYEGREAFVKTEFFEVVGEETVEAPKTEETTEEADTQDNTEEENTDSNNEEKAEDTSDKKDEGKSSSISKGKHEVTDTVKLRKEQNTDCDVLATIYKAETVNVVEVGSEWSKVEFKNKTGYIKTEFIKE